MWKKILWLIVLEDMNLLKFTLTQSTKRKNVKLERQQQLFKESCRLFFSWIHENTDWEALKMAQKCIDNSNNVIKQMPAKISEDY